MSDQSFTKPINDIVDPNSWVFIHNVMQAQQLLESHPETTILPLKKLNKTIGKWGNNMRELLYWEPTVAERLLAGTIYRSEDEFVVEGNTMLKASRGLKKIAKDLANEYGLQDIMRELKPFV